jgi:serine/threonine protein kinase
MPRRRTPPDTRTHLPELTVALHSIHANGIVHRDRKAANAFLDAHRRVKLTDYRFRL